jgi:hypothetical protein
MGTSLFVRIRTDGVYAYVYHGVCRCICTCICIYVRVCVCLRMRYIYAYMYMYAYMHMHLVRLAQYITAHCLVYLQNEAVCICI